MRGPIRDFAKDYLLPPAATRLGERLLRKLKNSLWLGTDEGRRARECWQENRGLFMQEAERARNRTLFILACGPSIAKQDLSDLIGSDCLSVSNFPVHELTPLLAPRYHLFAPYHLPFTEQEFFAWFEQVDRRLPSETTMLLPLNCQELTESRGLFADKTRHYLAYGRLPLDDWSLRRDPFTGPFVQVSTVSVGALLVAMALGYRRIALVGCDMTWFFRADGSPAHFFEDEEGLRPSDQSRLQMVEQFENHALAWRQFERVRDLATERGVEIVNCTDGGLLDVFPRASLKEALADKVPRRAEIAVAS